MVQEVSEKVSRGPPSPYFPRLCYKKLSSLVLDNFFHISRQPQRIRKNRTPKSCRCWGIYLKWSWICG